MTIETTTKTTTAQRVECPSCGQKAKRVSTVTLGALLKDEFAGPFAVNGHSCCDSSGEGCKPVSDDTGWRFCNSQECEVVYFSEEGDTRFPKSQLKVSVGVKETTGARPLCYCFGHSITSIKEELRTKGRSDALDDIRAKMKNPGCRCETENPSGACCLGSVTKGITTAQKELNMTNTTVQSNSASSTPSTSRGELIAQVGTVISAIMASACCWLPLVLLAVGVSGAGIAATLETYRPLFIVVTFGFLGAAFYFTYRPKKAIAEGGHGCCAPEETSGEACCATATKGRFSMMTFNKAMLWVVTVLAVAFLFFPSYVGALLGTGNEKAVTSDMNQAVIKVEGMTCEGCSATVAQAVRGVPGVRAVTVSYEKREAIVGTEHSQQVPKVEILAALQKAGYGGRFVETTAPAVSLTANATQPSACCALTVSDKEHRATTTVVVSAEQVSLFSVPLQCPSAPEIGCGSRAKPILMELERDPQITEAWLNHAGTLLAVVGPADSTRELRAKTVQATLVKRYPSTKELDGDPREQELRNFLMGNGWHRGTSVDRLSIQEAGIIAERLVRRLQAKVTISDQQASELKAAFTDVFEYRFLHKPDDIKRSNEKDELVAVARKHLAENQLAVFHETLAINHQPQPGEK